jgi:toxin ParE1/3/4
MAMYMAEENKQAADRMLDAIENEAHTLLLQPLMGRARPELADRVRSWPTSTPYILFYLTDDSIRGQIPIKFQNSGISVQT